MKKPKIYIMVGIDASDVSVIGREIAAESDCTVVSFTDVYNELYKDADKGSSKNGKVYRAFYQRIKNTLLQDKSVVVDAVNVSLKSRRGLLESIRNIPCYKIAYLVPGSIEECRNGSGEYVAGNAAIQEQIQEFEIPFVEAGVAHYYKHANVGCYYLLSHLESIKSSLGYSDQEMLNVLFLVNYHMEPKSWNADKAKQKWLKRFGEHRYKLLLDFNKCDMACHEVHKHSLVLIRDSLDRLLVYDDVRWGCKLFPNYKSDGEDLIRGVAQEFNLGKDDVELKCVAEWTHQKFSVSHGEDRVYRHKFYLATVKNWPTSSEDSFNLNGRKYYWLSIQSLEKDSEVMKKNSDIVRYVKTIFENFN